MGWHKWAFVVYTLQALLVSILIASGTMRDDAAVFGLTRQTTVWTNGTGRNRALVGNYTVHHLELPSGTFDVKWAIFWFLLLAAADHGLVWRGGTELAPTYRLLEYSVSAPLMAMAIAVEVGISDVYTLMCMFLLMSCCMWFGLVRPPKLKWPLK